MGSALTYEPTTNVNGSDSFTFTVNDKPVATAQTMTTDEDVAKAITLAGTDIENSTLTYTVVANPSHGALSGTAPALTYTPTADYNGSDSFTFKVNDGTVDSETATISITVIAVNDAPTGSVTTAWAQSVTSGRLLDRISAEPVPTPTC